MPPTKAASAAVKRAANARKAKGKTFSKHKPKLAPIDPNTLYPLKIFHEISGLGQFALTRAQKDGLPVHSQGGRKYVLGSEFIAFIQSQKKDKSHAG